MSVLTGKAWILWAMVAEKKSQKNIKMIESWSFLRNRAVNVAGDECFVAPVSKLSVTCSPYSLDHVLSNSRGTVRWGQSKIDLVSLALSDKILSVSYHLWLWHQGSHLTFLILWLHQSSRDGGILAEGQVSSLLCSEQKSREFAQGKCPEALAGYQRTAILNSVL